MNLARLFSRGRMRDLEVAVRVARGDLLACTWPTMNDTSYARADPPLTIHWIVPPVLIGSGGHHNIVRFIRYLESRGHGNRIYLYDPKMFQDQSTFESILRRHYPPVKAEVRSGTDGLSECDAALATSWETAYPLFNLVTRAKKFYFVQDYEPHFHPVGSESALAENTYRFGFYGITAGLWLRNKLSTEYSMSCDHYEFGSNPRTYSYTNDATRRRVVFYARPATPRRGFELGIFALEKFARSHPEYEIVLVGADTTEYRLPFSARRYRVLDGRQLNELYNQSACALVLSMTNMSLLPLELLAAGCIPVVNDGPNTRLVAGSSYIKYAQSSPAALAQAMHEVVTTSNLPRYAEMAAASVSELRWEDAGAKVEAILISELAKGS